MKPFRRLGLRTKYLVLVALPFVPNPLMQSAALLTPVLFAWVLLYACPQEFDSPALLRVKPFVVVLLSVKFAAWLTLFVRVLFPVHKQL